MHTLGGPPTASATAPLLPLLLQSLPKRWPLVEPLALARLHELARTCRVVQFLRSFVTRTAPLRPRAKAPTASDTGLCRFLLVDHSVDPVRTAPLTPVVVAPLPFPSSRQRSAHAFKAAPWFLFPAAETVVYLDAKVRLATTLGGLLVRFNWVLHPLIVLRHSVHGDENVIRNGVVSGIAGEHAVLAARKRENWTQDLMDIDTLRSMYCWGGGARVCTRWGGVIESSMLIWRRPSGRFDNGAVRVALRLLQGLWLAEIATLSHREQLSFTFVMDTLKLRDAVTLYLGLRDATTRARPTLHSGSSNGCRIALKLCSGASTTSGATRRIQGLTTAGPKVRRRSSWVGVKSARILQYS